MSAEIKGYSLELIGSQHLRVSNIRNSNEFDSRRLKYSVYGGRRCTAEAKTKDEMREKMACTR